MGRHPSPGILECQIHSLWPATRPQVQAHTSTQPSTTAGQPPPEKYKWEPFPRYKTLFIHNPCYDGRENPMQFNTWFGIKVADGTTLASGPTKQNKEPHSGKCTELVTRSFSSFIKLPNGVLPIWAWDFCFVFPFYLCSVPYQK